MPRCCLGLGGNLGDVLNTFARAAIELQDRGGRILVASHVFRTAPVGASAGEAYLNAAAVLETGLEPGLLLDQLQQIENQLGRTRATRWGPRTLDLDLLLYEGHVLHNVRLDVPHPGCLYRRFVLDPLAEIAGDWRHPETGLTIGAMLSKLSQCPLAVGVAGGSIGQRARLIGEIRQHAPEVRIVEWKVPASDRGRALISWHVTESGARQTGDREDPDPSILIDLDAPGTNDIPLLLSMVRAMLDVPVPVGTIPGL